MNIRPASEIRPMQGYQSAVATTLWLFLAAILISACSTTKEISYECDDPLGCVQIGRGEPVQLGVLQELSGAIAPLGQAQIRGLELALEKRGNVLLGHSVALQVEDTGCTSEGGANAALKIIADPQTVAIFGTTCSGAAATASTAMSAAGLTMVSGNNSAPFLTSIGGNAAPNWLAGYFRIASNEENTGRAAAEYAYRVLGIRKGATMHDNDIYTMGLADSFSKAFENLGGKIVLYTAANKGDTEMLPVLQAVANSAAELLFFPLFLPEGTQILLQARNLDDLKNTLLVSDGALIQQSFLDGVGAVAKGIYFVGPARPVGPAAEALEVAYEDRYREEPAVSYYITGYDAADILLRTIEQVAVPDTTGMLHIGRQDLRDALYGVSSFARVSGTLNCNRFGDCGQPAFNILRLDDPNLGIKGLGANIVYSSRLHQ